MSPRRGICAEVNGHGGKWLLFIFTCYVKNGETTTEYEAAKPEYRLFACGVLSLLEDVFVLSDAHKNQVGAAVACKPEANRPLLQCGIRGNPSIFL